MCEIGSASNMGLGILGKVLDNMCESMVCMKNTTITWLWIQLLESDNTKGFIEKVFWLQRYHTMNIHCVTIYF